MVNLGGAEPLNFFSVPVAGKIIWTLVFKRDHHSYSVLGRVLSRVLRKALSPSEKVLGVEVKLGEVRAIWGKTESSSKITLKRLQTRIQNNHFCSAFWY